MAGYMQRLRQGAGHQSPDILRDGGLRSNLRPAAEATGGGRAAPSGWWILPFAALGLAGWVLIIRAAWGWLA